MTLCFTPPKPVRPFSFFNTTPVVSPMEHKEYSLTNGGIYTTDEEETEDTSVPWYTQGIQKEEKVSASAFPPPPPFSSSSSSSSLPWFPSQVARQTLIRTSQPPRYSPPPEPPGHTVAPFNSLDTYLKEFVPSLRIEPVNGDGYCFYYAIYHQLYSRHATKLQIQEFKHTFLTFIYNFMSCLEDEDFSRVMLEFMCELHDPKDDIDKQRQKVKMYLHAAIPAQSWADHYEIAFMVEYTQIPIQLLVDPSCSSSAGHVHTRPSASPNLIKHSPRLQTSTLLQTTHLFPARFKDQPHHLLLFFHGNHYSSVVPMYMPLSNGQKVFSQYPFGVSRKLVIPLEVVRSEKTTHVLLYKYNHTTLVAPNRAQLTRLKKNSVDAVTAYLRQWKEKPTEYPSKIWAGMTVRDIEVFLKPNAVVPLGVYRLLLKSLFLRLKRERRDFIQHELLLFTNHDFAAYLHDIPKADLEKPDWDPDLTQRVLTFVSSALEEFYSVYDISIFHFTQFIIPWRDTECNHDVIIYIHLTDCTLFMYDPSPLETRKVALNKDISHKLFYVFKHLWKRRCEEHPSLLSLLPPMDPFAINRWEFLSARTNHPLMSEKGNGDSTLFCLMTTRALLQYRHHLGYLFDWTQDIMTDLRMILMGDFIRTYSYSNNIKILPEYQPRASQAAEEA